jgi:hypothetical protein
LWQIPSPIGEKPLILEPFSADSEEIISVQAAGSAANTPGFGGRGIFFKK